MDELELVELQFPTFYPVGTYVKVARIVPHIARWASNDLIGKTGTVCKHKTHHDQRWHRVEMDIGGTFDFLSQELQRYDD